MDDRRTPSGQRFVILRHQMPPNAQRGSHWDLMLENRGVLLTWELPELPPGPLPASFERLGIRRLPDHRIAYLEYEGPVSNDRGTVHRVDRGTYQLNNQAPEYFVKVMARGAFFQIELSLPISIFLQSTEPASNAGELLDFLPLSGTAREQS
jgi:DNA polymerase Ligase (LigD)